MRVCVVASWFPSALNTGAGSFIARDARALAKDNDVAIVHLVSPGLDDGVREFEYEGIPVERVPVDVNTRTGKITSTGIFLRRLRGFDLVHTMAAPALIPFVLRRPSIPWVHTEHWTGLAGVSAGVGRSIDRLFYERAFRGPDAVVAVSDYLAAQVRSLRGSEVDVIGNIVDEPAPAPRAESAGPIRLLGASNVIARKGWHVALAALEELRARGVDAHLTWLGDGPELDQFRERAQGLPVALPGRVDHAGVMTAMAEADVFVLPTDIETFSLVTVEALAAGLPVVASGVGAHTGFIDGGFGVHVERNAASIADGIVRARQIDRSAVRSQGAQLVARFSETEFQHHYREVYERVVR